MTERPNGDDDPDAPVYVDARCEDCGYVHIIKIARRHAWKGDTVRHAHCTGRFACGAIRSRHTIRRVLTGLEAQ